MKTVTVVIPAYNEGKNLAATIKAVKTIPEAERIIVVNDGSSDNTSAVARQENVAVIDLKVNQGKGGAMNAALPFLVETAVIVFLDADLGDTAFEARKIIAPVLAGEVDMCIAAFPPPQKKGGFGLVKATARWAIKKFGSMEANAPLSGQRAMKAEVLKAVTPFNEAYGVELGMTIKTLMHGYKIMEIPTLMKHNESGRDLKGFIHRGKQLIDVIKVVNLYTRRKRA